MTSRTARQTRVVDLLRSHDVRSQGELLSLLSRDGVEVTQATLSRDLVEVGAVKVRRGRQLVYALPDPGGPLGSTAGSDALPVRLHRAADELLVSARRAGNQVILRTPPGAANYLASCIDQAHLADVLGTIAGDDTVLAVSRAASGGPDLAELLRALSQRRLDVPGGGAWPAETATATDLAAGRPRRRRRPSAAPA